MVITDEDGRRQGGGGGGPDRESVSTEAETPDKALALARKLKVEDKLDLCFEAYDSKSDVNVIVVSDADGNELAFWYDEDILDGLNSVRSPAPDGGPVDSACKRPAVP